MKNQTTDNLNGSAGIPLSPRQIAILTGMGALLWFLAANLLRILGPMGIFEGYNRVLLYVLIVPGTLPFAILVWKIAGLARDQIALGFAVSTAIATLLDGVALAWFPSLYGAAVEEVAACGAAILWGAGVGLVLGFLLNRT